MIQNLGKSFVIRATPGRTATLSWSTNADGFIAVAINHHVSIISSPTGSVDVTPPDTTTYRIFLITERGGSVVGATVTVGNTNIIFSDGFGSGDTSAWSVTQ